MPELPEVETIRRQVAPQVVGRRLLRTEARLPRRTFPDVDTFVHRTQGYRIEAVRRHGKQMYLVLDNGAYLLVHLGMTGRLAIEAGAERPPQGSWDRHRHAVFHLEGGSRLVFTDPRTFGALAVCDTLEFLDAMGPDPTQPGFVASHLVERLKRTASPIKAGLLNQAWVAGLGNIYADEVLFLGGVHPARRGQDVPKTRLRQVVSHIVPVLERAILAGGATLADGGYQDLFGQDGRYHPYVYGNTGRPCTVCGSPIVRGVLGPGKSARSYHFCPTCQR